MKHQSATSRHLALALLLGICAAPAFANIMDELAPLQRRWAEVQYQTPEKARADAFEQLAGEAEQLVHSHAGAAEPLIWQGIILSTWAGAKGGLGALALCKQARQSLEAAIKIDPAALDGSAYTSLGSLYYQVPGWPVGFGDDDKAEELLKKALALAPDGIDANFFYGDYLIDQGRYGEAVTVLEHAAASAPRPGRELADQGRQAEIQTKLAKARAKL
ncbi:MAG: tetratricopeptide repeat protein [Lysobacterales bacterium]